jgi:hypothetical protein
LASDGGPARNIRHGANEGVGYWHPVWSPDSAHLALLTTAGGDNVRAYVWNRRSGTLKRLSDRGVDLTAGIDATGAGTFAPMQWVDNRRLLVIALPQGEQPSQFRIRRQPQRLASEAWKRAAQGRESTSSVLDSGTDVGPERPIQLRMIDVVTNQEQVLVEGGIRHVLLSPDREYVAVVAQAALRTAGPARFAPSRLGLVSLREGSSIRSIDGVFNPAVGFGAHSHRWSPRGSALAVLASGDAESNTADAVFVVSPKDLSVRRVGGNFLSPRSNGPEVSNCLCARAPADRKIASIGGRCRRLAKLAI